LRRLEIDANHASSSSIWGCEMEALGHFFQSIPIDLLLIQTVNASLPA